MRTERKIDRKFFIGFALLWAALMAAAFFFCTQKQGFHEDEYYTYYSTARTAGFFVEDGQWMERDAYRDEFVVLPGEGFQYGLVRQVQSWDVHPPMYYWVFHTVASLVPGVFSKWIGLAVNLFFHGINLLLLVWLTYLVSDGDKWFSLLVTAVYGFSPAAMSGVVFIRMYEMLTAFVLFCAILHVQAVLRNREKLSVIGELLPMAAVTYIGFLTQYYYFIFLFFLALFFCGRLLWRDKNLWNCLRYGFFQAAAFGLAYLTYPVFPAQMFRGQRGAQATESFFDLSNTLERIRFFLDLMNRYVFGSLFFAIVFVILLLAVCVYRRGGGASAYSSAAEAAPSTGPGTVPRFGTAFWMLSFAAAGYFLAVSKTALLLGETSNRYQLPIYGIAVLLLFYAGKTLWGLWVASVEAASAKKMERMSKLFSRLLPMGICLTILAAGYLRAEVVFLYPEDREQTAFAGEQAAAGAEAVYLYGPGEEWCIWDVTNELLAYDQVYFAAAGGGDIDDVSIAAADTLVVYLAKGADPEREIARLLQGGEQPQAYRLCFSEKYCDVYYVER